jgi:hypothetical protein
MQYIDQSQSEFYSDALFARRWAAEFRVCWDAHVAKLRRANLRTEDVLRQHIRFLNEFELRLVEEANLRSAGFVAAFRFNEDVVCNLRVCVPCTYLFVPGVCMRELPLLIPFFACVLMHGGIYIGEHRHTQLSQLFPRCSFARI